MPQSSNTATSENLKAQYFSLKVFRINCANYLKRHLSVLFVVSFLFQNEIHVDLTSALRYTLLFPREEKPSELLC